MLESWLESILICPICRSALRGEVEALRCLQCDASFLRQTASRCFSTSRLRSCRRNIKAIR